MSSTKIILASTLVYSMIIVLFIGIMAVNSQTVRHSAIFDLSQQNYTEWTIPCLNRESILSGYWNKTHVVIYVENSSGEVCSSQEHFNYGTLSFNEVPSELQ